MKVGMIGLGRMGANMVVRLIKSGHEVHAYSNRAIEVRAASAKGAKGSTSLQDFVDGLEARAQRLLFASAGTKDPNAPDTFYVDGLAAPHTVNTMPEATLEAEAAHGGEPVAVTRDGGDGVATLEEFVSAGVDLAALAESLQTGGAQAFVQSWRELLHAIDAKSAQLGDFVKADTGRNR